MHLSGLAVQRGAIRFDPQGRLEEFERTAVLSQCHCNGSLQLDQVRIQRSQSQCFTCLPICVFKLSKHEMRLGHPLVKPDALWVFEQLLLGFHHHLLQLRRGFWKRREGWGR